ncbi:integrin alpha-PS2-like [Culicoides brevitarsis]|uniref:integrin alpha-PS2-like n=1 Tax=Culicoides brevitarsis TaxID=469753 RepID=UPI00307C162C
MFGYTVSLFQAGNENKLLIGAPNVTTSHGKMSGAAYLCDYQTQKCEIIEKILAGKTNKAGQMLGATIVSEENGKIVVCAPKFYDDLFNARGKCFYIQANSVSEINGPYGNRFQRGFSAAISSDDIFLGDVGYSSWHGSCFHFPYSRSCYSRIRFESYSYAGYSMTVGKFNANVKSFAMGAPRYNKKGVVVIYDSRSTAQFEGNKFQIMGEQYGAYFGYSLATGDFNGDRRDDLLISAPIFSRQNIQNGYETGRVYIYLQTTNDWNVIRLTGNEAQSRFGTSVCSLGDINNDGIGDFAVGAPFAGAGKVFIYHGSTQLHDNVKPSQILEASGVKTFGFSIAGGKDIDGNGYPDIAVGAITGNRVFLYKTRPIVNVRTTLSTLGPISTKTACVKSSENGQPCTTVKVCLSFSGKSLPKNLIFSMNLRLDTDRNAARTSRVLFMDDMKDKKAVNLELTSGKELCERYDIQQSENFWGYVPDIKFNADLELLTNSKETTELQPILNRQPITPITLSVQKDCINECFPDLQVHAQTVSSYIYGDPGAILVQIQVQNIADDAFDTIFKLKIPPGFSYQSFKRRTGRKLDCSVTKTASEESLNCDLATPLRRKDGFTNFTVTLLHKSQELLKAEYELTASVSASNPDKDTTMADNEVSSQIRIMGDVQLNVHGKSLPEYEVFYDPKVKNYPENGTKEELIGAEIVHTYNFENLGRTAIEKLEARISWPFKTSKNEHFLYLLEVITNQPIECESSALINPENVTLKTKNDQLQTLVDEKTQNFNSPERKISKREASKVDLNVAELVCSINSLHEVAQITLRFRLVTATLMKMVNFSQIISTNCTANVLKLPLNMTSTQKIVNFELKNFLVPVLDEKFAPKMWHIVLAVAVGSLILSAITIFLWKKGFFKRKKLPEEDQIVEEEDAEREKYN